jgi:hypothetical protein
MPVLRLTARSAPSPLTLGLLVTIVIISCLMTILAVTLLLLRLKQHNRPSASTTSSRRCRRRRLTIEAVSHTDLSEKHSLMDTPPASPPLTLPEIRITFPDDEEREKAGRVVVVRMGDNAAVGLEPLDDEKEQLPPYQLAEDGRFQSLDLERIGGLKEKTDKRH